MNRKEKEMIHQKKQWTLTLRSGVCECTGCSVEVELRCRSTWTARVAGRVLDVLAVTSHSAPVISWCESISASFTRPASAAASVDVVSAAVSTSPSTPAASTAAPTTSDCSTGRASPTPRRLLRDGTLDARCSLETATTCRVTRTPVRQLTPTTRLYRRPTAADWEHLAAAAGEPANWPRLPTRTTVIRP